MCRLNWGQSFWRRQKRTYKSYGLRKCLSYPKINLSSQTVALYSCSIKNIKRGIGASSVAKSAYNSRSRLEDSRTGNIYDYSRKQDLGFDEIIIPDNAPAWVKDRQQLWAKNELANKRRDARVAKEILVALPRELDINEQLYLVRKFVAENLTPLGVIADVNAHELDPNILPIDERDDWNPHCHILISTQHIVDGEFGHKIVELNDRSFVVDLRKSWAELVNERLEAVGSLTRVDHRSNKARGINKIPQIHLGHRVWSLKQKGIATDRSDIYRRIEERNQAIENINQSVTAAIKLATAKKEKAAVKKEAHIEIATTDTAVTETVSYVAEVASDPEVSVLSDNPLSVEEEESRDDFSTKERVETANSQSKLSRLIELYYGSSLETVAEDVKTIQKLEQIKFSEQKSNSWLTLKLLNKDHTPEQIRRMLIHSQHTHNLHFDEAQQELNDNYQLALGVSKERQTASSVNNSTSIDRFSGYLSKHNFSIAKILFALAKYPSTNKTLKAELSKIGLDFAYSSKLKTFTLYEEGMPCCEYISGYYKTQTSGLNSKIQIVKDNLPSSLKSEVMDALFEVGFLASKRRRWHTSLKKITAKAEYGSDIPPALLTLNRASRTESKTDATARLDESDQKTIAVYYRPYRRLFNSQVEEIATFESLRPPSLDRQECLEQWLKALGCDHDWEVHETIEDLQDEQDEQEQLVPVVDSKSDVGVSKDTTTTLKPQSDPLQEKQLQGSQLAKIAVEILARRKQTQLQLNNYVVEYDSKQGRIEVKNQLDRQSVSVLVAQHEQNPDRWVVPKRWNVDLDRTEITDDFVRQILTVWLESTTATAQDAQDLQTSHSHNQIAEDLKSLKGLMANTKKSFRTNSMLAAKAVTKGYQPERIKGILAHSPHTQSLSPDEAQRSLIDAYRLASIIKSKWKTRTLERQAELPIETDYVEKISISITDIIIGLLRESSTTSLLREILAQFDLAISHSIKTGLFTIYELGNPDREYVSACWTNTGLEIVSDYLPKALKQDIYSELLKIKIPDWLPDYFDSVKFLKHRALRKGKNHDHPFALVSIDELRPENEPELSEINRRFERGLTEASSQFVVAIYSKPRPDELTELDSTVDEDEIIESVAIVDDPDSLPAPLESDNSPRKLPPQVIKALTDPLKAIEKKRKVRQQLAKFSVAQSNSYLESLGITAATLTNSRFAGTILTSGKGTAIFPHQSGGEITGYQGMVHNFDRFSKDGTKSLWQSNFIDSDRHLVIVQSPIDALAYHQLNSPSHTRYVAVGKKPDSTQFKLIYKMVRLFIRQRGTVITATENNSVGEQVFQQIRSQFSPHLVKRAKPKKLTWQQDLESKLSLSREKNSRRDNLFGRLNGAVDHQKRNIQPDKKTNRDRGYGE